MREITVRGRRYRLHSKGLLVLGVLIFLFAVTGLCFMIIGMCTKINGPDTDMAAGLADPAHSSGTTGAAGTTGPCGKDSLANQQTGTHTSKSTSGSHGQPEDDWRLVLVNATHPLPEGFTVETRELPNGLSFDRRAYDDLMEMIDDGQAQGLDFVICSAYRSIAKQQELYDNKVSECKAQDMTDDQAREAAITVVAAPGTSEHHTGLAVDIVAFDYQQVDEGILSTPEYQWLKSNCTQYGFIIRYPEGKSELTGVIFEPWHFRYVGRDAAIAITEQGLCLEEYVGSTD